MGHIYLFENEPAMITLEILVGIWLLWPQKRTFEFAAPACGKLSSQERTSIVVGILAISRLRRKRRMPVAHSL